ncbi:MAG TPA: hypothetical protein VFU07_05395 [Candidatus Lumbricidophila sp.]|nr:hypothetical protein [Candidatus Lumbricidophila sp.]
MTALEALRATFSDFYSNPTIESIADSPRWTVSGQLDPNHPTKRKAPIDMRELQQNQRLRGAYEKTSNCLMTLDELMQFLPNAANHTFALNAHLDRILVLDIEKTCPPEVARELIALPSLYSELSMSGQGYHLVMPMPASFDEFPIAANKVVLKEEHGWYEILIDHWITFTRVPIPAERLNDRMASSRTWDEVYRSLANTATQAHIDAGTRQSVSLEKPDIPGEYEAIRVMTAKPLPKTLSDFHGDHSRFEFSALSTLHQRLSPALPFLSAEYDTEYSVSMIAWLIYEAALAVLPHRAKHDEYRNQMPLLLNAATDLLARRAPSA